MRELFDTDFVDALRDCSEAAPFIVWLCKDEDATSLREQLEKWHSATLDSHQDIFRRRLRSQKDCLAAVFELFFFYYLRARFQNVIYEPPVNKKSPDFGFSHQGETIYLEVTCLSLRRPTGTFSPVPHYGKKIRSEIRDKNRKYRGLDSSLLVGLCTTEPCFLPGAMGEILYGNHMMRFAFDGKTIGKCEGLFAKNNGVFTAFKSKDSEESTNRSVSAVILCRLTGDGTFTNTVFHNPFAEYPLPRSVLSDWNQVIPQNNGDHWSYTMEV